jgi:hypothetical protein
VTDALDDFSDEDILDTAIYALNDTAGKLLAVLNPLTEADHNDVRGAGGAILAVADALAVLRERRNDPVDIGVEIGRRFLSGEINWKQVNAEYARETLALQGVTEPTAAQIGERMADLRMAGAWIGSIPDGQQ